LFFWSHDLPLNSKHCCWSLLYDVIMNLKHCCWSLLYDVINCQTTTQYACTHTFNYINLAKPIWLGLTN
jgi:hypothetical protein